MNEVMYGTSCDGGLPGTENDLLTRVNHIHPVTVLELGTSGDYAIALFSGQEAAHVGTGQDAEIRTVEGGNKVCLENNHEEVEAA